MKRTICLILTVCVCAAMLCACGAPAPAAPGLLEFPKTDWLMTPEQVTAALGAPDDALTADVLTLKNVKFFGLKAETAEFSFVEDSNGQLRLCKVSIIYPDDANMAKVRKSLEKTYGPACESYQEYIATFLSPVFEERTLTTTEHFAVWNSSKTVTDCAADPDFPLRADWQFCLDSIQAQDADAQTGGKLLDFYNRAPVVCLFWTDNGELPSSGADQPKNAVYFDAGILALMR